MKSRSVFLVLLSTIYIGANASAAKAADRILPLTPSHCSAEEVTYFTCRLKTKSTIISLCGAKNDNLGDSHDRHIEFRSGPPGKITTQFPEEKNARARDHFLGEFMQPYPRQVVVATIIFRIGALDYQLISEESATPYSGMWISQGNKINRLDCDDPTLHQGIEGLALELPAGTYR